MRPSHGLLTAPGQLQAPPQVLIQNQRALCYFIVPLCGIPLSSLRGRYVLSMDQDAMKQPWEGAGHESGGYWGISYAETPPE